MHSYTQEDMTQMECRPAPLFFFFCPKTVPMVGGKTLHLASLVLHKSVCLLVASAPSALKNTEGEVIHQYSGGILHRAST